MTEVLYLSQLWFSAAAGLFALALGLFGRLPSVWTVGSLGVVLLGLLIQFGYTTWLVVGGAEAAVDTVEFYAYLVVAIMVPVGAGFWALVERNRWSTVILGLASLTVTIMLVRMHQIWTGSY
ncbi:unannotated protein [freshwater metagenome]|uniref:Unannotated protein n=1 Tax=freshwater metagenome TaxID=449393 RepID=A0A6J6JLK9_9ZZZZ|nr:hypothetical protein [Actinomycetota bacterium]